jgi:hypothetical protein
LNGSFDLSPARRLVEDPDFISLPGKILGQVPSDFSRTSGNQDTHGLLPKKKAHTILSGITRLTRKTPKKLPGQRKWIHCLCPEVQLSLSRF